MRYLLLAILLSACTPATAGFMSAVSGKIICYYPTGGVRFQTADARYINVDNTGWVVFTDGRTGLFMRVKDLCDIYYNP